SEVSTESTTVVKGFNSGFDDDVIIFQGTLFESFEYEVVSGPDPAIVGSYFTIDIPATAKTYKWTVSKFNAELPSHAIGSEHLPHTIGDPQSYRSKPQTQALVAGSVGWLQPDATIVGEGSASNFTELQLTEEVATEQELSWTATKSLEFSVGTGSGTISRGITDSKVFTVTTTRDTTYAGEVGDMGSAAWDQWHYGFGLAVYTANLASPDADPTEIPFQVMSFWTDPTGLAYD
ncbi:MAG: hypothetical protein AAFZ65_20825, partial [Planctomycetota bacterium]